MKKKIILDPCMPCKKIGAFSKTYSYVSIHGANYGTCYRCTQAVTGVGRPQKEETYPVEDFSRFGVTGTFGGRKPINMAKYPMNPDIK